MAFNWRRDPSNPYLPADGSLAQMATNSMAGYQPLTAMTPHGNGMNGYFSNNAIANNSQGFSVPNQQHGGMAQPDLEGYGASLQAASDAAAQAQAKEQQIASIQSQIQSLEARIAENQAKLKNWSSNGVADQIAAIEARKINSADPTSIWRWKAQMDENRRIAEKSNSSNDTAKANAMIETANDRDSIIVDDKMTSQDQKAYLSKLSNLKTLGEKAGVPKSVIDNINAKIKEVKGETEQPTQEKPESVAEEDFDFEGGPRDVGEARATKILQKDPEKLTQNELATLKRDIMSGKISVSNDTKNKIDKIYSQVIERDKKRTEAKKREDEIIERGMGVTSDEVEFMKGRKGIKYHSDALGNEWFTRG